MTKRDWLSIGLRILGVWLALCSIYQFIGVAGVVVPSMVRAVSGEYSDAGDWVQSSFFILVPLLGVIAALTLMKWSDRVAAKLVLEDARLEEASDVDRHAAIFVLALKIIGAFAVIRALPMLVNSATDWHRSWGGHFTGFRLQALIGTAGWTLSLGIGAYLLLGGKLLVRLAFASAYLGEGPSAPEDRILNIGRPDAVFSLSLRIVGAVLLASRLPWLIRVVLLVFPGTAEKAEEMFGRTSNWVEFLGALLVLALGVYFLMGAKHLVGFVFRKRTPEPA